MNGGVVRVCSISTAKAAARACVCVIAALGVSACAMSQMTSPFRKDKSDTPSWNPTVSEERLLEAAKTDTTGQVDMASAAVHCPRFTVWPRDRLLTVYEVGRVGDGLAIQHRGEITKTARECQIFPEKIMVKYGFAGRVLLGPRGRPGQFTLPVKIHITDRTRNIVSTENLTLNVTITAENPIGFFSAVNQITIPLPPGTPPSDYQLFVAFDRKTPGAG